MAISRAQLAKELEPGLNALFGMEYGRYENQHSEIFDTESSDRSFEEEVMLSGFGAATAMAAAFAALAASSPPPLPSPPSRGPSKRRSELCRVPGHTPGAVVFQKKLRDLRHKYLLFTYDRLAAAQSKSASEKNTYVANDCFKP